MRPFPLNRNPKHDQAVGRALGVSRQLVVGDLLPLPNRSMSPQQTPSRLRINVSSGASRFIPGRTVSPRKALLSLPSRARCQFFDTREFRPWAGRTYVAQRAPGRSQGSRNTAGKRRPCRDGGEIAQFFACAQKSDGAFNIDPPTSSYAIMRRAKPYRGVEAWARQR